MIIAILGGSFDPPHNGHKLIAQQILKHLDIDEVWLMPVFSHPFNKSLSSTSDRLAMTKYLKNSKTKVSDLEINKKRTSFTLETLRLLAKQYVNYKFYWIIGSDQLGQFRKWKHWEDIIKDFDLIIYPRSTNNNRIEQDIKKYLKLKKIPTNIHLLSSRDVKLSNISSTTVRRAVKEKQPIHKLVPKPIEEYIKTHNLYL